MYRILQTCWDFMARVIRLLIFRFGAYQIRAAMAERPPEKPAWASAQRKKMLEANPDLLTTEVVNQPEILSDGSVAASRTTRFRCLVCLKLFGLECAPTMAGQPLSQHFSKKCKGGVLVDHQTDDVPPTDDMPATANTDETIDVGLQEADRDNHVC